MEKYQRGDIFYDINFRYNPEDPPCDKLLLILNKSEIPGGDVVTVPAKTHNTKYPYKNGCNQKEMVYYFEKSIGYYRDKSLIQFEFAERVSVKDFESRIRLRDMRRQGKKVSVDEINLILACLKSLKYDIPEEITELVF